MARGYELKPGIKTDKKIDQSKLDMTIPTVKIIEAKFIKDLKIILKDFEYMVKNPKYLWNGRRIINFNLLPREAWANWLICVVLRKMYRRDFTFMEDNEGDGFIVDRSQGLIFQTEHVSALDIPKAKKLAKDEQRIIDAINIKIARGSKYARGKLLVVFFDGAGTFFRDKIRENIFGKHNFEAVFCVGLLNPRIDEYLYSVTEFRDSFADKSITHTIEINKDFTDWNVYQITR